MTGTVLFIFSFSLPCLSTENTILNSRGCEMLLVAEIIKINSVQFISVENQHECRIHWNQVIDLITMKLKYETMKAALKQVSHFECCLQGC